MTDESQRHHEGASDVLAEDEVVHVPAATEELAESAAPGSTYLPDVPHWDDENTDPIDEGQ
jgi:hypothetical protein